MGKVTFGGWIHNHVLHNTRGVVSWDTNQDLAASSLTHPLQHVCIYIYTYICIHGYTQHRAIYIYKYIHVWTCICIDLCMAVSAHGTSTFIGRAIMLNNQRASFKPGSWYPVLWTTPMAKSHSGTCFYLLHSLAEVCCWLLFCGGLLNIIRKGLYYCKKK